MRRGKSEPGRASTICGGRGREAERRGIVFPAFLGKYYGAGPPERDDGRRCPKDDHGGHSIPIYPRPNNITRRMCTSTGSNASIQGWTIRCEPVADPLPTLLSHRGNVLQSTSHTTSIKAELLDYRHLLASGSSRFNSGGHWVCSWV